MATLVQQTAELFADNTSSIAPSITGVTAGNLVVMLVACSQSGTNTALTAPAGWSTGISTTGPGSGTFRQQVACFYKENAASGSHSGTVTFANNSFAAATIVEFSGVKTSSSLEGTNSSLVTATTSGSTGSASNTTANALVLAISCVSSDAGAMTGLSSPASSGYTNIDGELNEASHTGYQFSYKNVSSAASQSGSWTWTNNANCAGAVVIFGDASAAPTITVQPTDQTVNNGATATFSVTATGATSYQWKKNGTPISGATSSTVGITAAYADQGAQITVDCINVGGTTTSSAATLRVAFNLTGTGPRAYPTYGGLIGAGTVDAWLRGTNAGGGGSSGPVGTSTETDTAFARGSARSAGLSAETDTAFARGGVLIRATGLSTETDTALALTPRQLRAVGLSTEADTALALSGVQLRAVGFATETDTALALSASVGTAVGLASETDTALALAARQIRATGLAAETDTALALSAAAGNQVGLAVETDTALALAGVQIRAVGLSAETDTALARGAVQIRSTGTSLETDSALALSARQILGTGLASETDTALQLSAGGAAAVGLATETDTALALGGVTIPQIVIPQTSFAEFSGAVVKTKAEPKKPRIKAPKQAKRAEIKRLEPVLLSVGVAIEQAEALSLESWVIQRGLMRTAPAGAYPKLKRDSCPHCGAPAAHRHQ